MPFQADAESNGCVYKQLTFDFCEAEYGIGKAHAGSQKGTYIQEPSMEADLVAERVKR